MFDMFLKKVLVFLSLIPIICLLVGCQRPQDGKLSVKVPKKERKICTQKSTKQKTKEGRKNKSHKKENKIKGSKKSFAKLNYEELKVVKNRLVSKGNLETAINHLEKMMSLCSDPNDLKDNTLELADLLFDNGELLRSQQLFERFVESYPGDRDIEYAAYKSILCSYWSIGEVDRDQTKTKGTVKLSEDFLNRSDIFTNYAKEVSEILVDCQYRLFCSEVDIFKFYLNHNDLVSAENRLHNIEKEFLTKIPQVEPHILSLFCEIAKIKNDEKKLLELKEKIEKKYPEYIAARMLAYNNQNSFTGKF